MQLGWALLSYIAASSYIPSKTSIALEVVVTSNYVLINGVFLWTDRHTNSNWRRQLKHCSAWFDTMHAVCVYGLHQFHLVIQKYRRHTEVKFKSGRLFTSAAFYFGITKPGKSKETHSTYTVHTSSCHWWNGRRPNSLSVLRPNCSTEYGPMKFMPWSSQGPKVLIFHVLSPNEYCSLRPRTQF